MKGLFQEDHWAATTVEARLGQRERVDEGSRELFSASLCLLISNVVTGAGSYQCRLPFSSNLQETLKK